MLGSTYGYGPLAPDRRGSGAAAAALGVPARLLVVGQGHGDRLRGEFAGRVEVESTGHIDESEAVPLLRGCFLLYLIIRSAGATRCCGRRRSRRS